MRCSRWQTRYEKPQEENSLTTQNGGTAFAVPPPYIKYFVIAPRLKWMCLFLLKSRHSSPRKFPQGNFHRFYARREQDAHNLGVKSGFRIPDGFCVFLRAGENARTYGICGGITLGKTLRDPRTRKRLNRYLFSRSFYLIPNSRFSSPRRRRSSQGSDIRRRSCAPHRGCRYTASRRAPARPPSSRRPARWG